MLARNSVIAAFALAIAGPAAALPVTSLDAGWDGAMRSTGLLATPLLPPLLALASAEGAEETDSAIEAVQSSEGDEKTGPDEDFDLFGDTAAQQADLANPALEKEIRKRRRMLKTHQILGLTTLGLMTATAIVGQINYANLYGSHADGSDSLRVPHAVLAYTTTAAFATTAYFSVFAPEPIERESHGLSTVTLHKIAVIGASAGMLAQAGLGFSAARSADAGHPTRPGDLAAIHQVIGWTTLGLLATAATVWVF